MWYHWTWDMQWIEWGCMEKKRKASFKQNTLFKDTCFLLDNFHGFLISSNMVIDCWVKKRITQSYCSFFFYSVRESTWWYCQRMFYLFQGDGARCLPKPPIYCRFTNTSFQMMWLWQVNLYISMQVCLCITNTLIIVLFFITKLLI